MKDSMAEKFSSRAHLLHKGYTELYEDDAQNPQVKSQAQAGLGALNAVLMKVRDAGADLSEASQNTRDFYHAVTIPLLNTQFKAMEAHLGFLKNPQEALAKAVGAFRTMGGQGAGRDYVSSDAWKTALHSTMGVFSLNPNKWGMTAEEANAYDVASAQAASDAAAANPGFFDSISNSMKLLSYGGMAYFGWKMFFAPKGKNS